MKAAQSQQPAPRLSEASPQNLRNQPPDSQKPAPRISEASPQTLRSQPPESPLVDCPAGNKEPFNYSLRALLEAALDKWR